MLDSRWSKGVYLLLGVGCLALAKGDWPVVLAGVGFPYFLLRYTRSYRGSGGLVMLVVALYLGAFLGLSKRMVFFPQSYRLITATAAMLQVILPLLLDRFYYRRFQGWVQCLLYPCMITSIEYLSSVLAGGNWSVLGLSQLDSPVIMQAAGWLGLYWIGFATAFAGAFLNWIEDNHWEWPLVRKPVLVVLGIAGGWALFGNLELKQDHTHPVTRIAGIFYQTKPQQTDYSRVDYAYWHQRCSARQKVARALFNTQKAIAAGARIVAWGEAYLVIDEQQEAKVLAELKRIAFQEQVYLLPAYLLLKDPHRPGRRMENKAVLIDHRGQVAFTYRKSFLVRGVEDRIIEPGDREIPVFDTPYGRIGAVICYDMMFPQLSRQISQKKLDLLLVPGYDWRGVTPLATQVSAVAALENRTPFLRVALNGLSAAYDGYGRCLGQLSAYCTDQEIFICDLPIQRKFSLYGAGGWLFPYVIMGLTGLLLLWGLGQSRFKLLLTRNREGLTQI